MKKRPAGMGTSVIPSEFFIFSFAVRAGGAVWEDAGEVSAGGDCCALLNRCTANQISSGTKRTVPAITIQSLRRGGAGRGRRVRAGSFLAKAEAAVGKDRGSVS